MSYVAGDKVKYARMDKPAEILSGPHPSPGADRYLIRKADGNVSLVKFGELEPLDPRRDKLAQTIYTAFVRSTPWSHASGAFKVRAYEAADAVLADQAKPRALAKGDQIRVTRSGLEGADVRVGDVLTVEEVNGAYFYTDAPRARYQHRWIFMLSNEGRGWERV